MRFPALHASSTILAAIALAAVSVLSASAQTNTVDSDTMSGLAAHSSEGTEFATQPPYLIPSALRPVAPSAPAAAAAEEQMIAEDPSLPPRPQILPSND